VGVQFGQEADAIPLNHRRRLEAPLVIGEPFLRRQPGHPDIDARLAANPVRIGRTNGRQPACGRLQEDDIHAVVVF
jgi:hypothetical protein